MKKIACLLSFAISSSLAMSLDEIVDNALKNNQDINSIEKSIEIANENIVLAKQWKNPILTIGANDIHFDEPLSRDKEPMQAQYIGISQIIPIGKKIEIKEIIAKKDKEIISLSLEDKKLKLKSKIYEFSYNILILEKKLKLLTSYEKNIKKIEKLSASLYGYGKSNQNEILSAKIAYSKIQIKKQNLKNMIKNLYLNLEQITYSKINLIKAPIDIKELVLNMDIKIHPKIKMQKIQSSKFLNIARLEKENEKSDIKVNIAYFNRDSKYKDYANISVNIPLSIYKTEKVKALKAKLKANEISTKLEDLENDFKTKVLVLQNNINNAYSNYILIQKTILPLKRKMQKNIENYNSLTGLKPQAAIQNLNELISFEINSINQLKKYYSNYSKTKYYMTKVR
jgi:outer membrane protein TolC